MPADAVLEAAAPRAAVKPPAEPVQRWVWQSRYGTIVIEVRGQDSYVNGQKVVVLGSD